MKRFLFTLFLISASVSCQAQMLDNSKGAAFTDVPFFNKQFIQAAKIKEIKGFYTFKKQGDILRESKYVYVYSFDTLGQITRHYETASGDLVTDTVVKLYYYDTKGNLTSKRVSEKSGFLTTYYTHNDSNQVIKEEVWRDIDTMHSLLTPVIERSMLWNSETMSYEVYNGQHRKKIYNSYGNLYLEETRLFDSLGYLSKIEQLYTITRNQLNTFYTYTDKGLIGSIRTYRNVDSIPLSEVFFEYDAYGNVSAKKEYKNGVFTTEYQVIYSGRTGLLSSILIKEVSTGFLSIIRFQEASFWDVPEKTEGSSTDKKKK